MPASPSTARAINDRLALRLLQREGPLTAGQLKQLTGLSRPTVADLAERLTAAGLIEVVGESGAHRRGPNAKLYGIVASRASLAALDVRTDGVAVVVSDLVGRVLAEAAVPIAGDLATDLALDQAVTLVERAAKEAGADTLHTVCIGAPGLIEPSTGDLRDSNGLPGWHRRLTAVLQERFPAAHVLVENETNLAALAERGEGAARDRDTFVLLWLGQGVGAAVVLDGALRRGASGGTGEIGFLPVPGVGLPSATDCEGGFHSVAGGWAVERLAGEFGVAGEGAAGVVRGAADAVASVGGAGTAAGNGSAGGAGDAEHGDTAMPGPDAGASPLAGAPGGEVPAVPPLAGASAGPGPLGPPASAAPEAGDPPRTGAPGSFGLAASAAPDAAGDEVAVPSLADAPAKPGSRGLAALSASEAAVAPLAGALGGEVPAVSPLVDAPGPLGLSMSATPGAAIPSFSDAPGTTSTLGHPALSAPAPTVPPLADAPGDEATSPAGIPVPEPTPAALFLDALADRIALGVASVVAVLDPGCVVLGGEVGQAGGGVLARKVEARIRRMAPLVTEVRASALGGGAVLRGALLTAREAAQDELFGAS